MKRKFLFSWYQTPRGKLLKELEAEYLQRTITVSCQQTLLQIGGLGWEDDFIDCTLYKFYTILDAKSLGSAKGRKIQAKAFQLPLQCASVDMVIVPHLLEFDSHRFQTMREIERVLKPEGIILIMNFNPWSVWVRYQSLWELPLTDSWRGHFISHGRVMDWLRLLNFEVTASSGFYLDETKTRQGKAISPAGPLTATAYAIKAIKRRYNQIPLTPVTQELSRLLSTTSLAPTANLNHHD